MRRAFRFSVTLSFSLLLALAAVGALAQEPEAPADLRADAAAIHAAAPWAAKNGTIQWTEATLAQIRTRFSDLERARDKSEFCPGYNEASKRSREICWLRLVGAVAFFESSYEPTKTFREANGSYSVGLLMLSQNECDEAPTKSALKNPVRNLECGVEKMAALIEGDGFIDGPTRNRGAAAYWSTLRDPYSSGHLKLGRRPAIEKVTKLYKSY